MRSFLRFTLFGCILILTACNGLGEFTTRSSPHQQYADRLNRAELDRSAAGRAWFNAARRARDSTLQLELPASEMAYFDPQRVDAIGYELLPEQGEELSIVVGLAGQDTTQFFADLFERDDAGTTSLVHGIEAPDTLTVEASGQPYVLRLQPELLGGGALSIEIRTNPTLAFPVEGHDGTDVRSYFGDPRDGGARQHQGVDIFAPRGTPVVAAAAGIVRRTTEDRGLGGKTVWVIAPTKGTSYYYAHLDSVMTGVPNRVSRGDTLGLVGNTGNARRTAPHLHFEVRPGRPVNPLPFINTPRANPPEITAETSVLGTWMRTMGQTNLRQGPSTNAARLATLDADTPLLITGNATGWHRVITPAGRHAYVAGHLLESTASQPHSITDQRLLRHRPDAGAPAIASITGNDQLIVLGNYNGYLLIETASGQIGWLQVTEAASG